MAGEKDGKTQQPTHRRLKKAREKGQVARSKEVPSAVVLLGMLMFLSSSGEKIFVELQRIMRGCLTLRIPAEISITFMSGIFGSLSYQVAALLGPIFLTAVALAILANLVQTRGVFSWKAVGFHFEKLSPHSGLGRIFSKNGAMEVLKGLLILVVVSILSYQVVSKHTALYPRLVLMDTRKFIYWTASICHDVFLRVAIFLFIMAVGDFYFQKHRFTESLKMTKQEVKDEFKEMEGDPQVKGRIRRIQREMVRKRMMNDVPRADVVITNPTHYAVALLYKMESMEAPQVVAKGVGYLALKIKELAQSHDIPLVENKPLAQALYKAVEVGGYIPAGLYKAVAEILAYIYKARNAWKY